MATYEILETTPESLKPADLETFLDIVRITRRLVNLKPAFVNWNQEGPDVGNVMGYGSLEEHTSISSEQIWVGHHMPDTVVTLHEEGSRPMQIASAIGEVSLLTSSAKDFHHCTMMLRTDATIDSLSHIEPKGYHNTHYLVTKSRQGQQEAEGILAQLNQLYDEFSASQVEFSN